MDGEGLPQAWSVRAAPRASLRPMTDGMDHLHPETVAVRAGRPAATAGAPLNAPLVMASSFHTGGDHEYSREGNPTWEGLEEALGALEGGEAVAFASGMAAVAAVLEGQSLGARVVLPAVSYVTMRELMAERAGGWRLDAVEVDVTDTEATLAACDGAALLWLESPTNPLVGIADLATLAKAAHAEGAIVVVDNTFATPLLQRPLELGADLVVHSATKYVGGHSDLLLGAVVARDHGEADRLRHVRELNGATPGTLEAWLALRGLRTLPVRIERAQATATELARRLADHPEVTGVRYPGLPDDPGHALAERQMAGPGAMLAFEVSGGGERAQALCERVRVIVYATSLGGVETLIDRRARWPGEAHISPSLLRLSVGCEHPDDLWADLEQALSATASA
jgi:cystathionine gamma-synthase